MVMRRRTKRVITIEDIIKKIKTGQIRPGSIFPAAKELAKIYGISPRTAGTVIYELGQKKLLLTSPGRSSVVAGNPVVSKRFKFTKPIGILCPSMELMQVSHWREWLFQHIQNRLIEEGCSFMWLPEAVEDTAISNDYSGFIVAGELLSPARWEILQQTGLPCVRLSFFRPYANTVYIDYRPALDKIALYLATQKCRRIILLASCEREAKYAFSWFSDIGFVKVLQDYNIDEKGFHRIVLSGNGQNNIDNIRSIVTSVPEKTAFLACNPVYIPLITDIMKKEHLRLGTGYELISLSYAPDDTTSGRHIDLKCHEMIDNMLNVLHAQHITGEPQIARIIYADFVANHSW